MLIYWIWFAELKKLNIQQKQWLLEHFRDPEDIYHASEEALEAIEGMTPEILSALEDKSLEDAQHIVKDCAAKGIGILAFGDTCYPARLRNTFDAPVVLYYRGILPDWEARPVLGIVGTRKATPYGVNTARRFGRQIAACGALVVSGGAFGIDTMAMQGALEAGCPVVGVLGCGVDVVYPKSNGQFFAQVAEKGCLLSEYPPQTQPAPWQFPARNRIISGMSNGILVIEAPEKSGALNTAHHAMDQGRDVFVVPGNVDVPSCAGSNALLQEQAMTALSGWDVVKEYEAFYPGKVQKKDPPAVAQEIPIPGERDEQKQKADKKSIDKEENTTYSVVNNPLPALSEAEQAVLALIDREGSLMDEVIAQADLPAGTVKSILTKLTLKKLIVNRPGGRVIKS